VKLQCPYQSFSSDMKEHKQESQSLKMKGLTNNAERNAVCTNINFANKVTEEPSVFPVVLPMRVHRHVVLDCNVAFSCKLGSNESWLRPCPPSWNDDWQFATPRSGQPAEYFSFVSKMEEVLFCSINIWKI
jgi:hypothetical protein